MFWDFVEANQNIEGEHDGNVKLLGSLCGRITDVD